MRRSPPGQPTLAAQKSSRPSQGPRVSASNEASPKGMHVRPVHLAKQARLQRLSPKASIRTRTRAHSEQPNGPLRRSTKGCEFACKGAHSEQAKRAAQEEHRPRSERCASKPRKARKPHTIVTAVLAVLPLLQAQFPMTWRASQPVSNMT